jgi:hypothetical protein
MALFKKRKAKKKCKSWFPNDLELEQGCINYVKSLSTKEAEILTRDNFLSQIDQTSFFLSRGYDANPNDSETFEEYENQVNPLFFIIAFIVLGFLIYKIKIWTR